MRKTLIFSAAIMLAAGSAAHADQDFYAAVIAGQNPTVHWQLGEANGPTATNLGSLGATADGTYGSAVLYGQPALPPSSNNDAVHYGKNVQARTLLPVLPSNGTAFTALSVSFWVRGEDNGLSHFVGYAESEGITNAFLVGQSDSGLFVWITGETVTFPDIDILDGDPHHIGVSWQGAGRILNVYIDGQLAGTEAPIGQYGNILENGPLALGQDFDSFTAPYGFDANQAFDGVVDEFALFERILSPSEFAMQANPPSSSQIRFDIDSSTESLDETQDNFLRLTGTSLIGNAVDTSFNANANVSGIVSISVTDTAGTIPFFRDRGTEPGQYPNLLRDFVGHSGASSDDGSTIEITMSGLPNANYIVSTYHYDRLNVPNNPASVFDIFVDDANGVNQQQRDNAFVGAADPDYIGEAFEVTSTGSADVVIRIVEDNTQNSTYFNGLTLQKLTEELNVTCTGQTDTETQTLDCDSALFYRVVYDGVSPGFSLDTLDSPNNIDTEIALFDASGRLIAENDQFGSTNQSKLELSDLDAGTYYLAVAGWNTIFGDGFFVQQISDSFIPGPVVVTARSGDAPLLMTVNVFDPNAVTIDSNMANAVCSLSTSGNLGVTLTDFFDDNTVTIDTPLENNGAGEFQVFGAPDASFTRSLNGIFVGIFPGGFTPDDLNLYSTQGGEFDIFTVVGQPTVQGSAVQDLSNFSGMPVAGDSGNVVIGETDDNQVIGRWEVISEPIVLGEVNCDGEVNLLDVAPFIDLLSNGGFSEKADINGDDSVNLLDVDPFITLLGG